MRQIYGATRRDMRRPTCGCIYRQVYIFGSDIPVNRVNEKVSNEYKLQPRKFVMFEMDVVHCTLHVPIDNVRTHLVIIASVLLTHFNKVTLIL